MTSLNLCRDHWVCMYIWLYDARILVLGSVDFPQSSYKKFVDILHACFSTFLYYVREFGYDLLNSFELCQGIQVV